jgi:plasminogen activator inhibitor 1 RNA-binding protein
LIYFREQINNTTGEGNPEWAAQSEDTENVQPDAAPENNEEGAPEEETGPSEMTLDEWKALQNKEKQAKAFNVRKAGEGCDSKQWKQTFVLKKKVEPEDDEEESEEEDVSRPEKLMTNEI